MNTPHKHAENMRLYAEDAAETEKPWERWQVYDGSLSKWKSFTHDHPSWYPEYEYRRKPRTININGIEVPEPYRGEMKDYTTYFIPILTHPNMYVTTYWDSSQLDVFQLKSGVCHLTPEAAIKHAEALLSFTKQTT